MNRSREHLEQLFIEADGAPLTPVELRQFRRLAELLAGWRVLDDSAIAKLSGNISAKIREEAAAQASAKVDETVDPTLTTATSAVDAATVRDFRALDDLLQATATPMPAVDWKAFSSRVSGAVRREAKVVQRHRRFVQRRYFTWALKGAVPLAAAAVLAFAFWPNRQAVTPMAKGPEAKPKPIVLVTLDQPKAHSGKVSVTFDEAKPKASDEGPVSSTAIAIGPPRSETTEIPIDPALLP